MHFCLTGQYTPQALSHIWTIQQQIGRKQPKKPLKLPGVN